jgi:GNAT superfamily N-acetyltransferase
VSDSRISVQAVDPHGEAPTVLIAELIAELDRRYADRIDDEAHSFHPAQATVPRSIFLIATFDGEPVGCGALRPFTTDVVEIKRMYVREASRGIGVARAILAELERFAAQFGYKSMILETGVRQPEAIALYTRHGFTPIPNFSEYADNPLSVCYGKDIHLEGRMLPDPD